MIRKGSSQGLVLRTPSIEIRPQCEYDDGLAKRLVGRIQQVVDKGVAPGGVAALTEDLLELVHKEHQAVPLG